MIDKQLWAFPPPPTPFFKSQIICSGPILAPYFHDNGCVFTCDPGTDGAFLCLPRRLPQPAALQPFPGQIPQWPLYVFY